MSPGVETQESRRSGPLPCAIWQTGQLILPLIGPFRIRGGYNEVSRTILLVLFSFTYGLQVCYKLTTRQLVFLLNPCHVISLLEIYLLAALPYANPNKYGFRQRQYGLYYKTVIVVIAILGNYSLVYKAAT